MSQVIDGGRWIVRKRPVEVEAFKLNHENFAEVVKWCGGREVWNVYLNGVHLCDRGIEISTLEGSMFASVDDWIIRGVRGEFYPCKPDIFDQTYEMVALVVDDVPDIESYPMQDLFHG